MKTDNGGMYMSKFKEVMAIGKLAGFECNELFQMHEVVDLMQQAYEYGYLAQSGMPLDERDAQIVAVLTGARHKQMMGEEMEGAK
jgi:hypothetical protein